MEREELTQRQLHGVDLGQARALERSGHGRARRLPPPAAGAGVFEHRVERVHADQAEGLGLSADDWLEDAAGPAHVAIGHEDRLAANRVPHLVVIDEEPDRPRLRFTVTLDADHDAIFVDLVGAARREDEMLGLLEHPIGHEDVVGGDPDTSGAEQGDYWNRAPPTAHGEGGAHASADRDERHEPKRPAPGVQRVRRVEALDTLAARHGHDEVDLRQFEEREADQAEIEERPRARY